MGFQPFSLGVRPQHTLFTTQLPLARVAPAPQKTVFIHNGNLFFLLFGPRHGGTVVHTRGSGLWFGSPHTLHLNLARSVFLRLICTGKRGTLCCLKLRFRPTGSYLALA